MSFQAGTWSGDSPSSEIDGPVHLPRDGQFCAFIPGWLKNMPKITWALRKMVAPQVGRSHFKNMGEH